MQKPSNQPEPPISAPDDTKSSHTTPADGNVFVDLGFSAEDAKRLLDNADQRISHAAKPIEDVANALAAEQAFIEARNDVSDAELIARIKAAPDMGGETLVELSEFIARRPDKSA